MYTCRSGEWLGLEPIYVPERENAVPEEAHIPCETLYSKTSEGFAPFYLLYLLLHIALIKICIFSFKVTKGTNTKLHDDL